MEHLAVHKKAARFSPSRNYRRPFFKRIGRALPPLEYGLILPKKNAIASAKSGMSLEMLANGQKATKLVSQMIPAWVVRAR